MKAIECGAAYPKRKKVLDLNSMSEKDVTDYYLLYDAMASSKFVNTVTENSFQNIMDGSYWDCEYELLLVSDCSYTRRIVVPFKTRAFNMVEFIADIENDITSILGMIKTNEETDESESDTGCDFDWSKVLTYDEENEVYLVVMYDDIGKGVNYSFENAKEFCNMINSVRCIKMDLVNTKNVN